MKSKLHLTMIIPSLSILFLMTLSPDLISAEGGNFQIFIDGVEKGYDLTKYPDEVAVGYMLPEGSQHVEIFGTYVIPEFGETSLVVFVFSFLPIIYFWKKKMSWNVNK